MEIENKNLNNTLKVEKGNILERIASHLIINASFLPDLSLYHGKMGIVLFFAHYARYTRETLYDDFAGELLDEIYEEIHTDIPVNFESGLCGIGWAIEYLVWNKFAEGDVAEILEDIDLRIMERDPLRIKDLRLRTGLAGIAYYVAAHIPDINKNTTVLDTGYLRNLQEAICKAELKEKRENQLSFPAFLLEKNTIEIENDTDISTLPLGITNGISGVGLKYMIK
ncbi:MAG: hypothetical protein LBL58_07970 [Tannerellaceae bacterium]|jgi:hypothetical protein|nr:hypothetical protein [Tannerellaceae bacterium]